MRIPQTKAVAEIRKIREGELLRESGQGSVAETYFCVGGFNGFHLGEISLQHFSVV